MTIRGLLNHYNPLFFPTSGETLNEMALDINDDFRIMSSFYGSSDEYSDYISARVSSDVLQDDTLILFLFTPASNKNHPKPGTFKEIMNNRVPGTKMNLSMSYKIYRSDDPMIFKIPNHSSELFVNLITIRGTKFICDAQSMATNKLTCGKMISPRVKTFPDGAMITAYAYKNPCDAHIIGQTSLASIERGKYGLAIGVSKTCGTLSERVHLMPKKLDDYKTDHIVYSVSLT